MPQFLNTAIHAYAAVTISLRQRYGLTRRPDKSAEQEDAAERRHAVWFFKPPGATVALNWTFYEAIKLSLTIAPRYVMSIPPKAVGCKNRQQQN
jgi:hypothetical protein